MRLYVGHKLSVYEYGSDYINHPLSLSLSHFCHVGGKRQIVTPCYSRCLIIYVFPLTQLELIVLTVVVVIHSIIPSKQLPITSNPDCVTTYELRLSVQPCHILYDDIRFTQWGLMHMLAAEEWRIRKWDDLYFVRQVVSQQWICYFVYVFFI